MNMVIYNINEKGNRPNHKLIVNEVFLCLNNKTFQMLTSKALWDIQAKNLVESSTGPKHGRYSIKGLSLPPLPGCQLLLIKEMRAEDKF